jgi:hypothetical protein
MRRIKQRRYGREATVVAETSATHRIVIGYNSGTADKALPGKLNGFIVMRDTLDAANQYVVDWDLMARLGYTKEQVEAAKKTGFKAGDELLPHALDFVLMSDAARDGDAWVYPGTYAEAYECYGKLGLFCYGDGTSAIRKQDDGSKNTIDCNPFGKITVSAGEYCPYSGPGRDCKHHHRLTLCLLTKDADGRVRPLAEGLGMQARYRLDSSSEYGGMDALSALDAAADRCRGIIRGLTGTITFQRRARRTGSDKFSKAIVGHVQFQLHEEAILRREAEIREEDERNGRLQIEAGKAGVTLALPPPRCAQIVDVAAAMHSAPAMRTDVSDVPEHQAEPEPVAEAQPSNGETPAKMAEWLHAFVAADVLANDGSYQDMLNYWCSGSPDGFAGKDGRPGTRIQSVDWFLEGDAKVREKKQAKLREIVESIRARQNSPEVEGAYAIPVAEEVAI